MRWYKGGIADAVSASKKTGAIFVVYVEGKDNKSKELTGLIDSQEVSQLLENEHFVAIKVEENSVPHQQFSQIYKEVTVPSIFFIGKSGNPLEIITEPHSAEDLLSKLRTILQGNGVNVADQSDNFLKSERSQENPDVECDNGVCTIKPKAATEPSTSQSAESDEQKDLSPEDKVERAKELLNQKREAKRTEEDEGARAKELERRKMGQDVQKLKRLQQDNELKELMDERNKEKKEQQDARQRVLAQIAQDKAERAARFATPTQQPRVSPQISPQPVHRVVNTNSARLQFKLPDGSSHTHEFLSSNTLQDVRNYIVTTLNLPFNNFTLSTTFPRREFTIEEGGETLLALELVPNAVILVLPLHHGAVATNSNSSWLMTVFWSILGPFLNVVGYVKTMLFGPPQPRSPSPNPERKRPSENAGEPSNLPKRKMGESGVVRRQGNVHRLTDKTDSDDDNNTWNGNSTQQM